MDLSLVSAHKQRRPPEIHHKNVCLICITTLHNAHTQTHMHTHDKFPSHTADGRTTRHTHGFAETRSHELHQRRVPPPLSLSRRTRNANTRRRPAEEEKKTTHKHTDRSLKSTVIVSVCIEVTSDVMCCTRGCASLLLLLLLHTHFALSYSVTRALAR